MGELGAARGKGHAGELKPMLPMQPCTGAKPTHPLRRAVDCPPEPADDSAEENAPTSAERAEDGAREGTLTMSPPQPPPVTASNSISVSSRSLSFTASTPLSRFYLHRG